MIDKDIEFLKNIIELIKKSNQECERQHYHKSKYINDYDMQELYNTLDLKQSSL